MTASYSGSTNGFYQPSKATANYVIPSTCNQQSIIQEIQSQQSQLDSQLMSDSQYMLSMVQGAMGQVVNMGEPSDPPNPRLIVPVDGDSTPVEVLQCVATAWCRYL